MQMCLEQFQNYCNSNQIGTWRWPKTVWSKQLFIQHCKQIAYFSLVLIFSIKIIMGEYMLQIEIYNPAKVSVEQPFGRSEEYPFWNVSHTKRNLTKCSHAPSKIISLKQITFEQQDQSEYRELLSRTIFLHPSLENGQSKANFTCLLVAL